MTLERLSLLLDVYGCRLDRWPPADRRAAVALLAVSPAARSRLAEAERLDALLDQVAPPVPSAGLRARVLATAPARPVPRRPRPAFAITMGGLAAAAGLTLWLVRAPAPSTPLGSDAIAQLGVFDVPTDALLSEMSLGFDDPVPEFGCDDPALGCDELGEPLERSGRLAGQKESVA